MTRIRLNYEQQKYTHYEGVCTKEKYPMQELGEVKGREGRLLEGGHIFGRLQYCIQLSPVETIMVTCLLCPSCNSTIGRSTSYTCSLVK